MFLFFLHCWILDILSQLITPYVIFKAMHFIEKQRNYLVLSMFTRHFLAGITTFPRFSLVRLALFPLLQHGSSEFHTFLLKSLELNHFHPFKNNNIKLFCWFSTTWYCVNNFNSALWRLINVSIFKNSIYSKPLKTTIMYNPEYHLALLCTCTKMFHSECEGCYYILNTFNISYYLFVVIVQKQSFSIQQRMHTY